MAETEQAPELTPEPGPNTSGWYRNSGAVALTVQPDRYPSAVLGPGDATWLPADPQHPDLKPCDAPPPVADDTTGSEK